MEKIPQVKSQLLQKWPSSGGVAMVYIVAPDKDGNMVYSFYSFVDGNDERSELRRPVAHCCCISKRKLDQFPYWNEAQLKESTRPRLRFSDLRITISRKSVGIFDGLQAIVLRFFFLSIVIPKRGGQTAPNNDLTKNCSYSEQSWN